jgi:thiazole/oxazole-forming peptide maturase SagD family component
MIILPAWNRQPGLAEAASDSHVLRGKFYSRVMPLIMPLIDGQTPSDRIVESLAGRMAPEHVYYTLLQLQRQGLIRDAGRLTRPLRLAPSPKLAGPKAGDNRHRACSPQETIRRLRPFVQPDGRIEPGPFTLGESLDWIPRVEAEARKLAEAIERYCCRFQGDGIHARMSPEEAAAGRAVPPAALLHFSPAQYRTRRTWNRTHSGLNRVPRPLDAAEVIDWTRGWSLTHRREVLLPAAYCYFSFPIAEAARYCYADSNGCAAGNTREEAILTGALELVERDAVSLWWYNRSRRPRVAIPTFRDRFFASVARWLAARGRNLEVLDLTSDVGIPSFAAVSWRVDGSRIVFGFGTHLNAREAIRHALIEMGQSLANGDQPPELGRWHTTATIHNQPYLVPQDGPARNASDYPLRDRPDLRDDVRTCVQLASRRGLEVIVLDLTRVEIGFPVVRVVVPGLRSFAARLGPGRLYDVPVQLGWLGNPTPEKEMNPIPFFL